jgi:septal ring factor EnvC (AmiA/AmiB activator)
MIALRLAGWLLAACLPSLRSLRILPMNLYIRQNVLPFKPGDIVPAHAFTADQRAWLLHSGAVTKTADAATVDCSPAPSALLVADPTEVDVARLQSEAESSRLKLAKLQANLTAAQAELATAKSDLDAAEQMNEDLNKQLAAAGVEIQTLKRGGQTA